MNKLPPSTDTVTSPISQYNATLKSIPKTIHCQCIRLEKSIHVWIGSNSGRFENFVLTMGNTSFENAPKVLLYGKESEQHDYLAKFLAKRFKIPIFSSFDFNSILSPEEQSCLKIARILEIQTEILKLAIEWIKTSIGSSNE